MQHLLAFHVRLFCLRRLPVVLMLLNDALLLRFYVLELTDTLKLIALGSVVAILLCIALCCFRRRHSTIRSKKLPAAGPSTYSYSKYYDE